MFDKHADEAIEAEIWHKAEAKGRDKEREEMALAMLADNEPVEKYVNNNLSRCQKLHRSFYIAWYE